MAKKCSGCGADLPENVKFCIKCGLNLQGVTSQNLRPAPKTATSGSTGENKVNDQCPVCHKEVSNNAPYCIYCGSKLGDPIRTNIAGPAGISKDSEKDRVNIADIIRKPSASLVQQSGNNDLLSKINASKKEIAEAKKLLTTPTNPKVMTVQKEQQVQSNEKKKKSGPSLCVIMAAGLLIIIALVVWASVGHDNKKAASEKPSPQVSQQEFVYDEEAEEIPDKTKDNGTQNLAVQKSSEQGQIKGTNVNMREYPSLTSKVIFRFPGWEYVTIYEATKPEQGKYSWFKVSYKNRTGWVYGEFVKR
ncbi:MULTISPECIES: zinc-ribbon domain-containing protein [Synergistaceae]|uniref:zinc-ribbon domain-containing protein n=1 Tax=Synergistaceae TaxID=649777 RepID=UPI003AE75AF8|nr:zinc-ribbon domain-containing protein [Synergistaceae bacterium DZ-S4]